MPVWVGVLAALAVAGIGFAAVWQERHRTRALMIRLNAMLTAAIAGNFTEDDFDETLLSALETRLADYLTASTVSSKNLAEEQNRMKALVGDISHQTKTPIANLLLYTQLLQEQPLPAQAADSVQAIATQTEKLHFLIAALVKTSRLETGVVAVAPKTASVEALLRSAEAELCPKAAGKAITLSVTCPPLTARFDPKWTAEALYNVLDNAVKYTPAGGSVTVLATAYELFCRIDVVDTGPGIPESEQSKIFSRFYRGTAAADAEGVGIGLYLTRQILAAEGGYCKVASTPGKGSCFSLFLPREVAVPQIFQDC